MALCFPHIGLKIVLYCFIGLFAARSERNAACRAAWRYSASDSPAIPPGLTTWSTCSRPKCILQMTTKRTKSACVINSPPRNTQHALLSLPRFSTASNTAAPRPQRFRLKAGEKAKAKLKAKENSKRAKRLKVQFPP